MVLGRTHVALFIGLLSTAAVARADLAPPPRAKITLELTVEGRASVPHLKLFVTNCNEEPEKSVLETDAPLVCHPERGPVRVFGFREGDLIELFAKIRADAGREESAKFLSAKAKTCGEVEERDRVFSDLNVTLVQARYSVDKRDKDGCRLKRISATTKTQQELRSASPPAPPAPTPPSAAPAPAPRPSSEVAVGGSSSCSCELAPVRPAGLPLAGLVALGALATLRRRRER